MTQDPQDPSVSCFDGLLGIVDRRRIEGFAWSLDKPLAPETVLIVDNGRVIATVLANLRRPDLLANGVGDGRHGFDLQIPSGLSPMESHTIQVLRASDQEPLPGSPKVIPAGDAFTDDAKQAIAAAIDAIATTSELDTALAFVATQTSRLLQRRADIQGGREERAAFANFTRRWGSNLAASNAAAIEKPRPRLLIIVNRLPRASCPYLSSQLRSHAVALLSLGYDIDVVATEDVAAGTTITAQIPTPGVTICEQPYYGSAEEVLRRNAGCLDAVYVLGVDMATFYLRLARRLNPRARIVFSPGHFTHLELVERASVEDRPELSRLGFNRRFDELSAMAVADIVVASAASDYVVAREGLPSAVIKLAPFSPQVRRSGVPLAQRAGFALLAGRGDSLDFDAVHHLVEDILPRIWQVQPNSNCALVFSEVPSWAARLARPGVTIVLRTNEDDISILDKVSLTFAPYRFQAGLSTAVLDSFAAGVPCLMTPAASKGFNLPAGLRQLVCQSIQAFADRASALSNATSYNETVAQITAMMYQSFDQDVITMNLSHVFPTGQPVTG